MSRFVPAGTAPEDVPAPASAPADDAWAAARREVISRQIVKKVEPGKQEDGKSLYETLQANKAVKQAEFEESIRLKNQFQALNEDDVDFLDSVADIERAKVNAARRETAEQLDAYRKQQAAAQKVEVGVDQKQQITTDLGNVWLTKKRRKKEVDNPISKLRKTSSGATVLPRVSPTATSEPEANGSLSAPERQSSAVQQTIMDLSSSTSEQPPAVADTPSRTADLGLGAYSSDEE